MKTSNHTFLILLLSLILLPGMGRAQSDKSVLHVKVLDEESGQATPVRVHIMGQNGYVAPLPLKPSV
jgi:hypothetical protein